MIGSNVPWWGMALFTLFMFIFPGVFIVNRFYTKKLEQKHLKYRIKNITSDKAEDYNAYEYCWSKMSSSHDGHVRHYYSELSVPYLEIKVSDNGKKHNYFLMSARDVYEIFNGYATYVHVITVEYINGEIDTLVCSDRENGYKQPDDSLLETFISY